VLGVLALLGIDAETGVFMLLYLDLAYEEARRDTCVSRKHNCNEATWMARPSAWAVQVHDFRHHDIGLIPILGPPAPARKS